MIDTYYEPFIGGGSVMFQLLHSNIKVNKIVCSDINGDLISLWNTIKDNPYTLFSEYERMWNELNIDDNIDRRKEYFYKIRREFNQSRDPFKFLFLSRTCTNGLIRYNSKGEFNTSLHFTRKGINPKRLYEIITDWANKLNDRNVVFKQIPFNEIQTNEDDFVYADPPYAKTKGIYYGGINMNDLWKWLRNLECSYALSFDGKTNYNDNTYKVPTDLYNKHIYIKSGNSALSRVLTGKTHVNVQESLYIK